MPVKRQEGKFSVLYFSATDPSTVTGTDPEHDATNYTKVGLLADLSGPDVSNEAVTAVDRASGIHEDAIYGTQSSEWGGTCNVQLEDDSATAGEDAGMVLVRDAALNQTYGYWLIQYEDSAGSPVADVEGAYGYSMIESFSYTRNAGEFVQFEFQARNKSKPTFFTQG